MKMKRDPKWCGEVDWRGNVAEMSRTEMERKKEKRGLKKKHSQKMAYGATGEPVVSR